MYSAKTRGVQVTANPQYLEHESDPDERRFFWAYTIEIENRTRETIQLVARHWTITDENGRTDDVSGVGVVGEQPIIQPGETYTYTSGCPLTTPSGIMVGTYQMIGSDGELFAVRIPAFSLDLPDSRPLMN